MKPFEEGEQVVLKGRQPEKIMLLVAEFRLCSANLAERILDLTRFQVFAAALVALVPPGLLPQ